MGKPFVVLLNVEGDEILDLLHTVERVEEEPLVLQYPPPCFDHGVGKLQLSHGEDPAEETGVDQGVHVSVYVLYPAVGDDQRRLA